MKNGCHDRAEYAEARVVSDLYVLSDGLTEIPMKTAVPFVMSRDCQYTLSGLGQVDRGCDECRWRAS